MLTRGARGGATMRTDSVQPRRVGPGGRFFLVAAGRPGRAAERRLNLVLADPRTDLACQVEDSPEQFLQGLLLVRAVISGAAGAHRSSSPVSWRRFPSSSIWQGNFGPIWRGSPGVRHGRGVTRGQIDRNLGEAWPPGAESRWLIRAVAARLRAADVRTSASRP